MCRAGCNHLEHPPKKIQDILFFQEIEREREKTRSWISGREYVVMKTATIIRLAKSWRALQQWKSPGRPEKVDKDMVCHNFGLVDFTSYFSSRVKRPRVIKPKDKCLLVQPCAIEWPTNRLYYFFIDWYIHYKISQKRKTPLVVIVIVEVDYYKKIPPPPPPPPTT